MEVLVPFAADDPKTRLREMLVSDEREDFARAMLLDVCEAVGEAGGSPIVLSTDELACPYRVVVDDRPLSTAVNSHLSPPMAVVMADLALITPGAVERFFGADGDVVLAPGLGGGTNALICRTPGFEVDYHDASIRDHRRIAQAMDLSLSVVDSFRLAVDVDEPRDIAEVLLHGDGRAREWLEAAGFVIEPAEGRVLTHRKDT